MMISMSCEHLQYWLTVNLALLALLSNSTMVRHYGVASVTICFISNYYPIGATMKVGDLIAAFPFENLLAAAWKSPLTLQLTTFS